MSRRASVRKDPLREAIHHLANYLTFIAPMSRRTEAQAKTREEALATRMGFMAILEKIEASAIALAEDLDEGEVIDGLAKVLDGLHRLPQWKRVMAAKNAMNLNFKSIREVESANHPGRKCIEVLLTRDAEQFGDWLLGRIVHVDGTPWVAIAVEWTEMMKPFKAGTPIKLVLITPEEARDGQGQHAATPSQDPPAAEGREAPVVDAVEYDPRDRRSAHIGGHASPG